MAGYVPLFDSVLDGTLFGKWPHTGIWVCLLSQVDKHGVIDMNPNLLAAKIGVPVDMLQSCIQDFMKPDPGSRTKDNDGRRLELIDPDGRDWGWRVINHVKYREKARKQQHQQSATETGRDAERKKKERDVRLCPDMSGGVRPSDTTHLISNADTNADTNTTQEAPTAGESLPKVRTREGEMAIALRDLGVTVTSMDETLTAWVRDGFTVHQVSEATGLARMRKPYPERIPAAYIDPILRKPQKPPTKQVDRVTWRPPPEDEVASVSK